MFVELKYFGVKDGECLLKVRLSNQGLTEYSETS